MRWVAPLLLCMLSMTAISPRLSESSLKASAQSDSVKKKLRTMMWKPEVVMRETVLIQRLRELVLTGEG